MKEEKKSILIVDCCPLICEKYKELVKLIEKNTVLSFTVNISHNNEKAFNFVKTSLETQAFIDLIVVDLKLPPTRDKKILSGLDFALLVRKLSPTTKIVVATTCDDNYLIHSIFKKLNPEGFLIKSDLTSKNFKSAIISILDNKPYYSQFVLKLLRKEISNNLHLDAMDRKILYELSIGARMKDLPNFVPLSAAGIEKRKRHLRKILGVNDKGDRELIIKAREKGYL